MLPTAESIPKPSAAVNVSSLPVHYQNQCKVDNNSSDIRLMLILRAIPNSPWKILYGLPLGLFTASICASSPKSALEYFIPARVGIDLPPSCGKLYLMMIGESLWHMTHVTAVSVRVKIRPQKACAWKCQPKKSLHIHIENINLKKLCHGEGDSRESRDVIIEEGGLWGCFSYSPVMVMISTMIYKLKKREVLGAASAVVVNNDDHDDNDD